MMYKLLFLFLIFLFDSLSAAYFLPAKNFDEANLEYRIFKKPMPNNSYFYYTYLDNNLYQVFYLPCSSESAVLYYHYTDISKDDVCPASPYYDGFYFSDSSGKSSFLKGSDFTLSKNTSISKQSYLNSASCYAGFSNCIVFRRKCNNLSSNLYCQAKCDEPLVWNFEHLKCILPCDTSKDNVISLPGGFNDFNITDSNGTTTEIIKGKKDYICSDCNLKTDFPDLANCHCANIYDESFSGFNTDVLSVSKNGNRYNVRFRCRFGFPSTLIKSNTCPLFHPDCIQSPDNNESNNTNPNTGGGGSGGDNNNTNPNTGGGGGSDNNSTGGGSGGGSGGGGGEGPIEENPKPDENTTNPNTGGSGDDNNNSDPNNGAGGIKPKPIPNVPKECKYCVDFLPDYPDIFVKCLARCKSINNPPKNPKDTNSSSSSSNDENLTGLVSPSDDVKKDSENTQKAIEKMSKDIEKSSKDYLKIYDDVKDKITKITDNLKNDAVLLKKSPIVKTCPKSFSLFLGDNNHNIEIDFCKQVSTFYNIFYVLTYITIMFFGLKYFLILLVMSIKY